MLKVVRNPKGSNIFWFSTLQLFYLQLFIKSHAKEFYLQFLH